MRAPLAILIVVLAACGEAGVEPLGPPEDPPGPLTIARVSGESQAGVVGELLEQPLVVRVRDASGRDASGVEVGFAAVTGGGTLAPSPITTGADGLAQATFTLGPIAGQQTAVAAITLGDSAFAGPAVSFTATAAPGPPAAVVVVRGNEAWGCAGRELLTAFVARIEDRFGNPVPNVPLEWTITEGGGVLSEADHTTNDAGEAAARLALGAEPGVNAVEAAAEGLDPVRFTATAGDCQALGSIAFESVRGIETIEADGSGRAVLIPGTVSDPDWSPDGARIAYSRRSDDGRACAIHIARADGSEEQPVTPYIDGQCDSDPAWSPDGSMIALARRGDVVGYQIAVVNVDGSNPRILVAHSPNGIRVGHAGPTWSPDATTIAFWFVIAHTGGGPRIAVVPTDGTAGFTVIRTLSLGPAWSPDGSHLAFVESGGTLSLMNPDGSGAASLGLPEELAARRAAWSPDGARIVFSGGPSNDLYIINRDGTELRQVISTAEEGETEPSWRSESVTTGALVARP